MAILGTQTTSTLSTGGKTENNLDKLRESNQHDIASLTGKGLKATDPQASGLDLDGKTPEKYVDNLPK